jgi:hypothetical protein
MSYDEDEAELEMERARQEDLGRSMGPVGMGRVLSMRGGGLVGGVPPQVKRGSSKLLTCCHCGFASSTHIGFRVDPRVNIRGVVCDGRYDETGAPLGCFEKLDRELAVERGRDVERDRQRIRAQNERARGPRGGGYEP